MKTTVQELREIRKEAYEQGVKDSLESCPHGCVPPCPAHRRAGEVVGKFFEKNLSWNPPREEDRG
jgi:hypothetical protein